MRKFLYRGCLVLMALWSFGCLLAFGQGMSAVGANNPYAGIAGFAGFLMVGNVWFMGFVSLGVTALLLRKQPLSAPMTAEAVALPEPPEETLSLPKFMTSR